MTSFVAGLTRTRGCRGRRLAAPTAERSGEGSATPATRIRAPSSASSLRLELGLPGARPRASRTPSRGRCSFRTDRRGTGPSLWRERGRLLGPDPAPARWPGNGPMARCAKENRQVERCSYGTVPVRHLNIRQARPYWSARRRSGRPGSARRDVVDDPHQLAVGWAALGRALGGAEVRQMVLPPPLAIEQDIARLHVSMDRLPCRRPASSASAICSKMATARVGSRAPSRRRSAFGPRRGHTALQ